jgi:hypothetical protein
MATPPRAATSVRTDLFLYALAGASYVGASIVEKGLLNWIVGPAWCVAVVAGVPALGRKLRQLRPGKRAAP